MPNDSGSLYSGPRSGNNYRRQAPVGTATRKLTTTKKYGKPKNGGSLYSGQSRGKTPSTPKTSGKIPSDVRTTNIYETAKNVDMPTIPSGQSTTKDNTTTTTDYTGQRTRKKWFILSTIAVVCVAIAIAATICFLFLVPTQSWQDFLGHRKCSFDRMLFGTVYDEFARYHTSMGVYINYQDDAETLGRPRYKHEFHNIYMYHTAMDGSGYWVVANDSAVYMRVESSVQYPNGITRTWTVRGDTNTTNTTNWVKQELLVAVCVRDDFTRCHSGTLRLSALEEHSHLELMGVYAVTNEYHNLRPIYRNDVDGFYLYHADNMWTVSKQPPSDPAADILMSVNDLALRAEFIIRSTYDKQFFEFTCLNQPAMVPARRCTIPFHYKDHEHTACTDVDSTYMWCSYDAVYDGDWDYCEPAMQLHPDCVSEFWHPGERKTYNGCTQTSRYGLFHQYWCSTTRVYSGKREYCLPTHIKPDKDCRFPFTYRGRVYKSCTHRRSSHDWCGTTEEYRYGSWVYCINIRSKPHAQCKFPFEYRGKSYENCIVSLMSYMWCSTTSVFSGDWQYCKGFPVE